MRRISSRGALSRLHQPARLAALAALAGLTALFLAGPAVAQTAPRLQGLVTDLTQRQVLAPNRAEIERVLTQVQNEDGIQLFALFVDTTGSQSVGAFASEVGSVNSLGTGDALLVVALSDRTYWLAVDPSLEDNITADETEQIRTAVIEPRLRAGDYAGAVTATATGLADAQTASGPVTGPGEPVPGPIDQPVPAGGVNLVPILAVGLLVLGAVWVFGALASQRRVRQQDRRTAEERDRRTGDLAREANQQLIGTDDALRDAQQELGFAEAEFGDAEIGPYRDALRAAGTEMKAAFALRQKLDDSVPEDAPTREAMLREILARATKARGLLDEQRARIEQLRDLERSAPQILSALPAQLDAAEARIPEAESTLEGLSGYAESSTQSVRGNVAEARKRLAHAREQLEGGRRAQEADDRPALVRHVRSAQEAMAEATRLLDAIGMLAKSLRAAEANLSQELVAATADVTSARVAVSRNGSGMAGRLGEAEAALQAAQREIDRGKPDYLAAYRLATQANAIADEILAGAQEAEQRRAREREVAESALRQAEASYSRAEDYIASRRRGVGRAARTRLVEAEGHLERAQQLIGSDPRAALAEAQRAYDLAEEAYAQAVDDFDDYDQGVFGGGRRGGIFPFPVIIGGGGGWGGGAGRSGGGWGGTPWGSSGGGGGFGGGGFGGGGSGGGGFGGGSSGGGRW